MTEAELKDKICKFLVEKKAEDVIALKVDDVTTLVDYFIICTGRNTTQVSSLANNLMETMKKEFDVSSIHAEGVRDGKWAVVDYGLIMVHIFNDQTRMFYNLEQLWMNSEKTNVEMFK